MLILDVEASGTDYALHSIVSIGALDLGKPDNRFYGECRIWDGAHVMEEALAVNGFTEAQLHEQSKPTETELVTSFFEWSEYAD